jgi:hypothetical protein
MVEPLQALAGDDEDAAALGVACEPKLYSGKCQGWPNLLSQRRSPTTRAKGKS